MTWSYSLCVRTADGIPLAARGLRGCASTGYSLQRLADLSEQKAHKSSKTLRLRSSQTKPMISIIVIISQSLKMSAEPLAISGLLDEFLGFYLVCVLTGAPHV